MQTEVQFSFEHDGVLIRGFLDVLHRDGDHALVVDYKTNTLAEHSPDEIVEHEYRLQRLVYALACFRSGATEVEVVYHFLERPDARSAQRSRRTTCPRSRPSCRPRSRAFERGSSSRRRATTRAPGVRRSTWCVPGRGFGVRMRRRSRLAA